jgi:aspartokinase-like uncharacterized kinase
MNLPRMVVKLGGSFLHRPRGIRAFRSWFADQPPAQWALIVGGGMAIDAMRDLDRLHPLDQTAMHWRCIQMLDATYGVVRELLSDWQAVDQRQEWEAWAASEDRSQSKQILVRIGAWYSPHPSMQPVSFSYPPEDWRTTTDALAVLMAHRCRADRVILLKSVAIPMATSLAQAHREGWVDPACVAIQGSLPVELIGLSDPEE